MTWLLGFLGLPAILAQVLRFLATVAEIVAPILVAVIKVIAAGLRWLWLNVWWPGLRGALDGLPQVLVIAQLFAVGFLLYLNASTQLAQTESELRQCRTDLTKARKPVSRSQQSPPLWDPFGWFRL